MKRQKPKRHIQGDRDKGFTLIEVLIAILILSVGLLGMASLTVAIIQGNKFSNNLTTATTLAQDKMEDVRRLGYSGTPTSDTTEPENYNSITGYATYKRITVTTVDSPAVGMKAITVTVYWQNPDQTDHLPGVELKTILAQ